MKLRLVRINPLTLDPGEFFVMCGRNTPLPHEDNGGRSVVVQFPARLEYLPDDAYNSDDWKSVEFVNEFQSNESDDARKVRPEVQVPVYSGPSGNKRRRSDKGS